MSTDAPNTELVNEVQEERGSFDLLDRLVNRPKRKPEVVEVYLDEELGEKLGAAYDVKNEYGTVIRRERRGLVGELDAERAKVPEDQDAELIEKLASEIRELGAELRADSLTFTLQWIPPIAEEVLEKNALEAVGLKSKTALTKEKMPAFQKEWGARAICDTLVSVKDSKSGLVKTKLEISEAQALINYLPPSQWDRLDAALGRLLFRDAISREALDNADF